jgi:hypothetical protein
MPVRQDVADQGRTITGFIKRLRAEPFYRPLYSLSTGQCTRTNNRTVDSNPLASTMRLVQRMSANINWSRYMSEHLVNSAIEALES